MQVSWWNFRMVIVCKSGGLPDPYYSPQGVETGSFSSSRHIAQLILLDQMDDDDLLTLWSGSRGLYLSKGVATTKNNWVFELEMTRSRASHMIATRP